MSKLLAITADLFHLPGFYEPFSAISHLLGIVIFLVLGGMLLWRGRGDRTRLIYLGVYAASCVLLFSMSMCFHMMAVGGTARLVMERLDHSAIFILIVGTFTPIHGLLFRGAMRWAPLVVLWTVAIAGITLKAIFLNDLAEWLGLSFYLALGWVGLGFAIVLARQYGYAFIRPLVLGGVAYSVGAVAEYLNWPTPIPGVIGPHEMMHVAVLAGALLHFWFVWQFADGKVGPIVADEIPRGELAVAAVSVVKDSSAVRAKRYFTGVAK